MSSKVARQQLPCEQNANSEVLAACLHLGRLEMAENDVVARCANREIQDTSNANSSTPKLVIEAPARCADQNCSSSPPPSQNITLKQKNVPSNLFTFAPQAYAEEKGVSRRL
jgi:hypothetical protein